MARVLVIDDDAALRRTVARILAAAGHEVREAANGKLGLKEFKAAPADLVVTDIVMPEGEGIETILALRREGAKTRIIAMTGSDPTRTALYLNAAQKLGADAVLAKPFRAEELRGMVERLLGVPA